jgi:hypothetical protein
MTPKIAIWADKMYAKCISFSRVSALVQFVRARLYLFHYKTGLGVTEDIKLTRRSAMVRKAYEKARY